MEIRHYLKMYSLIFHHAMFSKIMFEKNNFFHNVVSHHILFSSIVLIENLRNGSAEIGN